MPHFPAVHVNVKDNRGSSASDLVVWASEVTVEGAEPEVGGGGTPVELYRTVHERRDRGNEERMRRGRRNCKIREQAAKFTERSMREGSSMTK